MDFESKFTQSFCCLKCRGRSAVARIHALPRAGIPPLLGLGSDKYVFVSCTLCGYTEIYNPAVFVTDEEESSVETPSEVPQQM